MLPDCSKCEKAKIKGRTTEKEPRFDDFENSQSLQTVRGVLESTLRDSLSGMLAQEKKVESVTV